MDNQALFKKFLDVIGLRHRRYTSLTTMLHTSLHPLTTLLATVTPRNNIVGNRWQHCYNPLRNAAITKHHSNSVADADNIFGNVK